MGKNKLSRFAENLTFSNVTQPTFEQLATEGLPIKGKWNSEFFHRDAPIVLELGCGRGEYTIGLAELDAGRNFIGVDIKGARIWRGARNARERGLRNVGFLRTHVDHITRCFGPAEVDSIWLTFSDPQLGKARKRLTSPLFLQRYKEIMKPGGFVHLKTDSQELYEYTLAQIADHGFPQFERSDDVYGELVGRVSEAERTVMNIRTYYESMWLAEGRKIHYIRFGIH